MDNEDADKREPGNEPAADNPNSGIAIARLTVTAGKRTLLEDASATFPPRQITLIVGPSGVGKSVLLRLMAGLLEVHRDAGIDWSGEVQIDGSRIRAGDVGVVFQSFALFDELSPEGNVDFARSAAAAPLAKSDADLLDELRIPRNVPTSRLSGGQRQRLAIARTLAYNPSAILYDEPTSGLDPATGQKVAQLIRGTNQTYGKTSVVVTHDYASLLPIADRVYLLDPDQRKLVRVPADQWDRIPRYLEAMADTIRQREEVLLPVAWQARLAKQLVAGLQRTGGAVEAVYQGAISLIPWWRSPRWGLRFLAHFARLVFGPTAWIYLIIAGIISGFVVTYFTFKFLPYANYTEPLLIEDLLTALGFAMYRIFVPVLASILVAARCGAAITADIGGRQFGNQIDALRTFGSSPRSYLLSPIVWSFLIGTPLLTLISFWAARWTSLITFINSHPDEGADFWDYHFHRGLRRINENWYRGTDWLMVKLLCCAFGVALIAYYLGRRPKYSSSDVSRSVTATILWSTLFVLVVHFVFAFYEYEGLVAGGR